MIRYDNSGRLLLLMASSLLVALLPNLSLASWSQTISQQKTAECSKYSVRRVEFVGNEKTRDRIVRRRVAFSEGKALSEQDIDRTIKNLNRLKHLEKLKREDIEIRYAVTDPATPDWRCFADILIHVKERTRL